MSIEKFNSCKGCCRCGEIERIEKVREKIENKTGSLYYEPVYDFE